MEGRSAVAHFVVVALAILLLPGAATSKPAPVRSWEQGLYGLPVRLRDLTDLQYLTQGSVLTALQKTEVELNWLATEKRDPSPPSSSLGGCPIDSDYIQRQLIVSLSVDGDPAALDLLLASRQPEDDAVRDDICLALAAQGDSRRVGDLIRILRDDPSQGHRYLAAQTLGILQASVAIPELERALYDPYSVTAIGGEHYGETFWPVRLVAKEALSKIRNVQSDSFSFGWRDPFQMRVVAARRALAKDKLAFHRLVLAASGKAYGGRKIARNARPK